MTNKKLFNKYMKDLIKAGANKKVIKPILDLYNALIPEEKLGENVSIECTNSLDGALARYAKSKSSTK